MDLSKDQLFRISKIFYSGNVEAIKGVVEEGFDLNTLLPHCQFAMEFRKPLEILTGGCHLEALEYILPFIPLDYVLSRNVPVIHDAIDRDPEVLRLVVNRGFDLNVKFNSGWHDETPLTTVITSYPKGEPQILKCRILLNGGADPKIADERRNTPINYIIQYKHKDLISLFLEFEVDFEALDSQGRTYISYLEEESELYNLIKSSSLPGTKGAIPED